MSYLAVFAPIFRQNSVDTHMLSMLYKETSRDIRAAGRHASVAYSILPLHCSSVHVNHTWYIYNHYKLGVNLSRKQRFSQRRTSSSTGTESVFVKFFAGKGCWQEQHLWEVTDCPWTAAFAGTWSWQRLVCCWVWSQEFGPVTVTGWSGCGGEPAAAAGPCTCCHCPSSVWEEGVEQSGEQLPLWFTVCLAFRTPINLPPKRSGTQEPLCWTQRDNTAHRNLDCNWEKCIKTWVMKIALLFLGCPLEAVRYSLQVENRKEKDLQLVKKNPWRRGETPPYSCRWFNPMRPRYTSFSYVLLWPGARREVPLLSHRQKFLSVFVLKKV